MNQDIGLRMLDFSSYTAVKKKCIYYSGWPQKVVVRQLPLIALWELTLDDGCKGFYVRAQQGGNGLDFHAFVDYKTICRPAFSVSEWDTLDQLKEKAVAFSCKTYWQEWEQHLKALEDSTGYISALDIRLAEIMGDLDGYLDTLTAYRDQKLKALEEQKKRKCEQKIQRLAEERTQFEAVIAAAERSLASEERIENLELEEPKSTGTHSTVKLLPYLFHKHDIQVPLRTLGWVNSSLRCVGRLPGGCWYLQHKGNPSRKIAAYLEKLYQKISMTTETPYVGAI